MECVPMPVQWKKYPECDILICTFNIYNSIYFIKLFRIFHSVIHRTGVTWNWKSGVQCRNQGVGYGIGAMKLTANWVHNNRSGELKWPCGTLNVPDCWGWLPQWMYWKCLFVYHNNTLNVWGVSVTI